LPAPTGDDDDDTNAQACVDALEAASAGKCADARASAQDCGTEQHDEIVAAVEKACVGK
jgi:hypothetical protein